MIVVDHLLYHMMTKFKLEKLGYANLEPRLSLLLLCLLSLDDKGGIEKESLGTRLRVC